MAKNLKDLNIGIIGAGKLGTVLARFFGKRGQLLWIADISNDARNSIKSYISDDVNIFSSVIETDPLPDIIFLTVNDSQIENAAKAITKAKGKELESKVVIFCSGMLTLSVLNACKEAGAKTFGAHPYQTFYHSDPELLHGISWGVEAVGEKDIIKNIIEYMGGSPYFLGKETIEKKAAYHCSAVIASNFLTTALAFASEIAKEAKIPAVSFFPPIVETTINNCINSIKHGEEIPLTGPLARNDIQTIKKHFEALKDYPDLQKNYAYLTMASAETSYRHNLLKENELHTISKILFNFSK